MIDIFNYIGTTVGGISAVTGIIYGMTSWKFSTQNWKLNQQVWDNLERFAAEKPSYQSGDRDVIDFWHHMSLEDKLTPQLEIIREKMTMPTSPEFLESNKLSEDWIKAVRILDYTESAERLKDDRWKALVGFLTFATIGILTMISMGTFSSTAAP